MPELYKIVTRSSEGAMCLLVLSRSLILSSAYSLLPPFHPPSPLPHTSRAYSSPRHLVLRHRRFAHRRIAVHVGLLPRRRYPLQPVVARREHAVRRAAQLAHPVDCRVCPPRSDLPGLLGRVQRLHGRRDHLSRLLVRVSHSLQPAPQANDGARGAVLARQVRLGYCECCAGRDRQSGRCSTNRYLPHYSAAPLAPLTELG